MADLETMPGGNVIHSGIRELGRFGITNRNQQTQIGN